MTSACTVPSTTFGPGAGRFCSCASYASSGSTYATALVTPGTARAAARTASRCPASAITTDGVAVDAGKCAASRSCAVVESTVARNDWVRGTPCASRRTRPSDSTTSTSAVPAQTIRGRRPTTAATRVQRPRRSPAALPYRGRNGQNTTRPHSTSAAGSRASMHTSALTIPTAATGPRPRVEPSREASRQSRAMTTVPPLAAIGGSAARQAVRIASYRSSWRRSSSR